MSKLLTVFGATGLQGGSLVDYVLKNPELSKLYRIRGITRDASKATSLALKERGAEVVEADLNKPASLAFAIEGSYAVFGVTNCESHHPHLVMIFPESDRTISLGASIQRYRGCTRKSH